MIARLALALLVPLTASAQLTLVTFDGAVESAVGSSYDYGRVATGETKDVRFRARNNGTNVVALTTLTVSGTGFTKVGAPSLPASIAPGNFIEFVVRFSAAAPASYSASFLVNSISVILLASSVPAPTVTVFPVCTGADPIDFGRVQRGVLRLCNFSVLNTNTQPLVISTLTVSGDAFQGPKNLPPLPLTLRAGEAVTFTVNFTPPAATSYTGTLTIGTRTYRLAGSGFDPPLPKPLLQFDSTSIGSAQQRTLTMRLAAPSPVTASGLVTLAFTPSTKLIANDPAVMFIATSPSKVPFAVNQGDVQFTLDGQPGVVLQTGTTAGTITFSLSGTPIDGDATASFAIPAAAISIDTATASRRVNDLDVAVTGYDNTYTAGSMTFTFFDTAGNAIGGAINADFTANFKTYFTSIQSGSAFLMRVTFPVTGDATQVAGVEVGLANSVGVSRTQRIAFR